MEIKGDYFKLKWNETRVNPKKLWEFIIHLQKKRRNK